MAIYKMCLLVFSCYLSCPAVYAQPDQSPGRQSTPHAQPAQPPAPQSPAPRSPAEDDRRLWLQYLDKVARPVLSNLAEDRLRTTMPVTLSPHIDNKDNRSKVTYLEAWGRILSGIAPWLNAEGGPPEEITLRQQYRQWALKAVANSVNPAAGDYMVWNGGQPLVDASFFALGLVRCPWLWTHLDPSVQQQVVTALKLTRPTLPAYSNWILFPAMIETFFCKYDQPYDPVRIEYAVREFSQHWYLGDGTFSDGPAFHQDYYNSYVIQPFLSVVLAVANEKEGAKYRMFEEKMQHITRRYAEIQERMINTDGSFPVTGRSITYRCGAFHHLADMAARSLLPASLPPGQVRSALTAVIKKTLMAPATFTAQGWLNIGLYGRQEKLADSYITGGSGYLCSEIFLPLGLPPSDPFWSSPPAPWTAVKVWSGADSTSADHALDLPAGTSSNFSPAARESNPSAGPREPNPSSSPHEPNPSSSPREPGYKLVWSDEFNRDGRPDPQNWTFEQGFVRNHEAQWYQPDNAWCADGRLIIEARKENKPNPLYEAGSKDWRKNTPVIGYTSACLLTRGLHVFQYGRFEMRARIDVDSGLWPAFWTLGEKGPWPSNGEIDIMEYYRRMLLANIATGTDKKNKAFWYSRKVPVDSLGGETWARRFHTWQMDWDQQSIRLSVDDRILQEVPLNQLNNRDSSGINPFRQPHYLLLNLALGGDNGGDLTQTSFPRRFEIDYIRVYQKDATRDIGTSPL